MIGRFEYGLDIVYSKADCLVPLKQEIISRNYSWTTVMYTTGFVAHYRRKTKGTEGLFSTPPFPFFLFLYSQPIFLLPAMCRSGKIQAFLHNAY